MQHGREGALPRFLLQDPRDAGRLRARNHGIELAGEIGKIEMAVAVDQCQSRRQMMVFCGVCGHVVEATGGQVLTGYSEGIVSRVARAPPPPVPLPIRALDRIRGAGGGRELSAVLRESTRRTAN